MVEALAASGLCVSLAHRPVLRALSLQAHFGEVVAIVGPNGAGKSTLLRTLAGLLPYAGEIRCAGTPLAALSRAERARRLSFVPQQSQLRAAFRVHEVVAQGRYVHRSPLAAAGQADTEAVAAAIAATELGQLLTRSYDALSSGEQKRVLLARALATGARILLLDEPTAALDIEHTLRLFGLLRTLAARGHAVLLVVHQLEHALHYADRVYMLSAGELLASGAPAAVITPEHVRTLYGVELVPGGAPSFRLPGDAP